MGNRQLRGICSSGENGRRNLNSLNWNILLVLDANLEITDLFAKGKTAVLNGEAILKGRFE